MSQNNNDFDLGEILVVMMYGIPAGIVLFPMGAFMAVIFTICSLIGLIFPFENEHFCFNREYSWRYLRRSIGAGLLVTLYFAFCEGLFGINIHSNVFYYASISGYILGGFWDEFIELLADVMPSAANPPSVSKTSIPKAPEKQELLPPPPSTYRYASWDDEEEQR